jgi:hypothetical protein
MHYSILLHYFLITVSKYKVINIHISAIGWRTWSLLTRVPCRPNPVSLSIAYLMVRERKALLNSL